MEHEITEVKTTLADAAKNRMALVKIWGADGSLDGLPRYEASQVGVLQHNQKTILKKENETYNRALLHAIRRTFGDNFMFSKIVSHEALDGIDKPVYYLETMTRPGDSEPYLTVSSDQLEFNEIQLNASFTDTESFARDIEWQVNQLVLSDICNHIVINENHDCSQYIDRRDSIDHFHTKLIEVSNQVAKKTKEKNGRDWSTANWIITHPLIADKFFEYAPHHLPTPPESELAGRRFSYLSTVRHRWRVYTSWNTPKDEILMGYRGESFMDSGLIYGTHIPFVGSVENTNLVIGKKETQTACYARIKLHNFVPND